MKRGRDDEFRYRMEDRMSFHSFAVEPKVKSGSSAMCEDYYTHIMHTVQMCSVMRSPDGSKDKGPPMWLPTEGDSRHRDGRSCAPYTVVLGCHTSVGSLGQTLG